MRSDDEGGPIGLSPHALLFAHAVTEARQQRSADPQRKPLSITSGVPGLGQAMIDVAASARHLEGGSPEWLAALKHAFEIGDRPTLALGIGEVVPLSVSKVWIL